MLSGLKPIILDSWAVLAYLQGEPSAEKISSLISGSQENKYKILMSVINLGEVWYIIAREISEKEADAAISTIVNWGIEIRDADWQIVKEASRFKSKNRISYADSFAAALAKMTNGELVTGDREFKTLEAEIQINWLK
ncbi:MAG TPA: PIN domain nuclease [Lentisphaeria bacterium]|nr:PIN domain nuclease [Lentisphaeria bacterium]